MTDKRTQAKAGESNMEKDPSTWVTGDEPMTGAQRSYVKTLSEEAKEPFNDSLTKAQASVRIDELQEVTGRAPPGNAPSQRVRDPAAVEGEEPIRPEKDPAQLKRDMAAAAQHGDASLSDAEDGANRASNAVRADRSGNDAGQ